MQSVFLNIQIFFNHVQEFKFTFFTTTSSPSGFMSFCSGKNVGAVCSGVVDVPLDELLLLYGVTNLSCAKMSPARFH
jgi:hypothetical protein